MVLLMDASRAKEKGPPAWATPSLEVFWPCGEDLVGSFRSGGFGAFGGSFHAGTGGFSAFGHGGTGSGGGVTGGLSSGTGRSVSISGGFGGRLGGSVGLGGFIGGRLASGDRQGGDTDGSDEELADDHDAFPSLGTFLRGIMSPAEGDVTCF